MTQLDGKSMNIIEQNIEKLKEIFPEVFSEGKIDFSKLEEELGTFKENENERYNFTWNGKSEAKKIALTPSTGTLRPCKEESKDWDTTQNLYIEGDNLEVLKLLQKSYHKKVKMIYIDPPYNTGKDFVYKDNFRDNIKNYLEITGQVDSDGNKLSTNSETSGRYHSDWLNMMYPRLKLARNLLKDDGVIFISIDDNEVSNLRKLCDEIFGEDNFVESIIWKKRTAAPNDKKIGATHEYILMYARNISEVELFRQPRNEIQLSRYQNPDNHPKGKWIPDNLMANVKGGRYSAVLYYPIINPHTGEEHYPSSNGNWRYNKNKIEELIKNNELYFGKDGKGRPKLKRFLSDVQDGVPFPTNWDNVGYSNTATKEVAFLLNSVNIFDTPKPLALMKNILNLSVKNDIVLDFFSGSATIAHAVMKQNSEDDGYRKYICVQLPEITQQKEFPTICEIGKERIRRAGEKVKSESGKDDLDIGFKVLKLDSSNIKSWDSDFENLETNLLEAIENIKDGRNEEDLLYEILLKYGLDLTLPINKPFENKNIYNIGFGALIICLDNNISIDITDEIIAIKKEYDSETTRVVFKDSGFKNATEKTNIIKTLNQNGIDEVVSV
jgi:adenine-specific DNA-methyltransferase